jgi:hypothetical protein
VTKHSFFSLPELQWKTLAAQGQLTVSALKLKLNTAVA